MRILDSLPAAKGPAARVVILSVNPAEGDNVIVESRDGSGQWRRVMSFNSLSNDYAYTAARDYMKTINSK